MQDKPEGVLRGERSQPFPGALGRRGALRREGAGGEELNLGRGLHPGDPDPLPQSQFRAIFPQVLTALDRDASCRKHKLRQKLEQIISLMSSNS